MKQIVAYIAGPVTGLDIVEVQKKFAQKESELEATGALVYNPVDIIGKMKKSGAFAQSFDCEVGNDWKTEMRECILLLAECDEIHMLEGWQKSKGARLEHHIANELGMKVCYDLAPELSANLG